jgi:uncharacterized repeat protein (TIGR01451 family)
MSKLINAAKLVRRRKFAAPVVLAAGILSVAATIAGSSGAISGFSAGINNTNNTVASGTLLMSETQGGTTCLSSAAGTVSSTNIGSCGTINKFGGSTTAVPGQTFTSTVVITNNGSVPANTFTLTPQGCTQTTNGSTNGVATDFCSKVNITINDDTNAKCIFPASATAACGALSSANTLTSLGTATIALATPMAPGASRTYSFKVQLDAAAGNNYQGLGALEQLNWAFAS